MSDFMDYCRRADAEAREHVQVVRTRGGGTDVYLNGRYYGSSVSERGSGGVVRRALIDYHDR
jgi:hypothetical protein